MSFRTGYLYFINPCRASIPVKPKFAICMSAKDSLFYLINSCDEKRPYKHEEDHVVFIEAAKFKSLTHRSYINVTKPRIISAGDYNAASEKEYVANDLWLKIRKAARNDRRLSGKLKAMIEQNR